MACLVGQDGVLWLTNYTFGNSSSLTFVNLENLHELKFESINNDTIQESSSHDLKNLQTALIRQYHRRAP